MMNKTPRTPEDKQTRYFLFCRLRNEGYTAENIAAKLLEPDSLPTALYRELGKEGFPVCQWCGAYSANKSFCAKHLKEIEPKRKSRAAYLGEDAIELPPAREASDLFREAIAELSKLIDPPAPSGDKSVLDAFLESMEADHNLFRLEEYLQGEHIVSYSVDDRYNVPVIYRKDFTAEQWEAACEEFGASPSEERIIMEKLWATAHGAKKAPAELLVKLIGAYVLTGKPLEPLVEKLNHAPETVDWEKLDNFIHGYSAPSRTHVPGMFDMLRKIATEVRGGTRRLGRFYELFDREVETASTIADLRRAGLNREEIYEWLKDKGYTRSDVDQLSKSRPERPDWELPD
jgi:hypothetical protein